MAARITWTLCGLEFSQYSEAHHELLVFFRSDKLEWIGKLTDLVNLKTRHFALASSVSGSLLLLPKSFLAQLNLDVIPAPYGAILGLVFLVATGFVVVNSVAWVFDTVNYRRNVAKREAKMIETLERLDPAEQAVLREFHFGGQKSVDLPFDNPVVAGLITQGIIVHISSVGRHSMRGMMSSFRISKFAQQFITLGMLGISEFHLMDGDDLSDAGVEWLNDNRPHFTQPRGISGW